MMALYSDLFKVMRIDQEETFAIVLIIVMHIQSEIFRLYRKMSI